MSLYQRVSHCFLRKFKLQVLHLQGNSSGGLTTAEDHVPKML